jgi:hypothetical protein
MVKRLSRIGRVDVTRVDLGDGQTLQIVGRASTSMITHLRLVASAGRERLEATAEQTTRRGRVGSFHMWIDLSTLFDASPDDIVVTLDAGRRRHRWREAVLSSPNADVVLPTVPDPQRRQQCTLALAAARGPLVVRRVPLPPRVAISALTLDDVCEVILDAESQTLAWVDGDESIDAQRHGPAWRWSDLSLLARSGRRWQLRAQLLDGSTVGVELPVSDLRDQRAARVFPSTTTTVDGIDLRLAAGVSRRVVTLRCLQREEHPQ